MLIIKVVSNFFKQVIPFVIGSDEVQCNVLVNAMFQQPHRSLIKWTGDSSLIFILTAEY